MSHFFGTHSSSCDFPGPKSNFRCSPDWGKYYKVQFLPAEPMVSQPMYFVSLCDRWCSFLGWRKVVLSHRRENQFEWKSILGGGWNPKKLNATKLKRYLFHSSMKALCNIKLITGELTNPFQQMYILLKLMNRIRRVVLLRKLNAYTHRSWSRRLLLEFLVRQPRMVRETLQNLLVVCYVVVLFWYVDAWGEEYKRD